MEKRIHSFYLFMIVCISVPIFSSCVTPLVYGERKVAKSEMCQIRGSKEKKNIGGKNYMEAALLVSVDSHEVGNYCDGWPKTVKATEGNRVVVIRHYKGWGSVTSIRKPFSSDNIAQSTSKDKDFSDYFTHYQIKFNADKGKKYLIVFKTLTYDDNKPYIALQEETTGASIPFQVEAVKHLSPELITQR